MNKLLARFVGDRRANLATSVALLIPLIGGLAGGVIDLGRTTLLKERAQGAADASVIMLAKQLALTRQSNIANDSRDRIASKIFRDELGPDVSTTFAVRTERNRETRVTTLTATSSVPTMFLRIAGIQNLNFSVSSSAQFDAQTFAVEMAFVLNTSASMSTGRKTTALSEALLRVMDSLDAINKASPNRARVALIPFQLGVTVPSADSSSFSWPLLMPSPPSNCVVDRDPPYSYTGAAVSVFNIFTKHPVFEPTSSVAVSDVCDGTPITPMTTDLASVRAALPAPSSVSGTDGAIGLTWGWAMLTPGAPFSKSGTIPLEADHKLLKRALIYVTDGENTGNPKGQPATVIDDWSLQLCSRMKAAGITVITINIDGEGSEPFLRACATSPERYKKVPAPDLPQILDDMTEEITGYTPIRLVR